VAAARNGNEHEKESRREALKNRTSTNCGSPQGNLNEIDQSVGRAQVRRLQGRKTRGEKQIGKLHRKRRSSKTGSLRSERGVRRGTGLANELGTNRRRTAEGHITQYIIERESPLRTKLCFGRKKRQEKNLCTTRRGKWEAGKTGAKVWRGGSGPQ